MARKILDAATLVGYAALTALAGWYFLGYFPFSALRFVYELF